MSHEPKTLVEAIRHFADPDVTLRTMVELRWPDGVTCPTCGSKEVRPISTRRMWECKSKHPKRQFSAKVGTIFEDSALPLDKWFIAIWALANCKNGISSYELHRATGITQKSAWFVLHRIRLAMNAGSIERMDGEVEADETYLGGKFHNMHAKRRNKVVRKGPGGASKHAVLGILRRKGPKGGSRVKTHHVENSKAVSLLPPIREAVEPGTIRQVESLSWACWRVRSQGDRPRERLRARQYPHARH